MSRARWGEAGRGFWWSFYEGEATFHDFLDTALPYASRGEYDPSRAGDSEEEKAKALALLLQREALLFVLDGFERQLSAYATLNAAYQGDAVSDDSRAFADTTAKSFFRYFLSAIGRSRILITSRLMPAELEGRAGCKKQELCGISPEDAEQFLRAQGVKGGTIQIRAVCEAFGYLPLALRLLAGLIVHDPANPGAVRAPEEYNTVGDKLIARKHHVLELAYNALRDSERLLLSQIAAFRFPVTYAALDRTLCAENEEGGSSARLWSVWSRLSGKRTASYKRNDLQQALRVLVARGLIFFDRERNRFDLHPIVRQYAYDRLADKQGTHTRLRNYYSVLPLGELSTAHSIQALKPAIELYHHTLRAGLPEGAFELLLDRLEDPLLHRFCAVEIYSSLISALFERAGENLKGLRDRSRTLAFARGAHSFRLSGEPRRAVRCTNS